jgi:hypothetical protein
MTTRIRLCLALFASVLLHTSLLFLGPRPPEVGKNTPVLNHPVRTRQLTIHLNQSSTAKAVQQFAMDPLPTAPAEPPPSTSEGKVQINPKIYAETSDHYFTPAELDERPTVDNPPDLGAAGVSPTVEGEASLLFYINEKGSVDRIVIEQSSLPESMMEQLQQQREQLRFTPGKKNEVNVKSVVRFKIALAKEATVIPPGSSGLPKH